jgi:AbrB family looped-hinge helix DNA binding protein
VRAKGRVTIPEDVRLALNVQEGERFEVSVTDDGSILLRRRVEIDPEQAWFWTPAWQGRMRESLADIAGGRTTVYRSDDEFLAALDEHIESD